MSFGLLDGWRALDAPAGSAASLERDVCRPAAIDGAFEPDAAEGARMEVRHSRFRALYPAVAGGHHDEAAP